MGTAGVNATDGILFDWARGITYESFSPLCGPCDGSDKYELINGTLVTSIGAKYNKTGCVFVLFCWCVFAIRDDVDVFGGKQLLVCVRMCVHLHVCVWCVLMTSISALNDR
jgi:hypothetical protein